VCVEIRANLSVVQSTIQIAYLRHFTEYMEKESQESAQALFKPFLRASASTELFKFYLSYVG